MTLKIHVIIHHYADYFEHSGLTIQNTNGEFSEAIEPSPPAPEGRGGTEHREGVLCFHFVLYLSVCLYVCM